MEPRSRRKPRFVFVSAREQVFLGQIALILPDVHVIRFGGVAGLYLDLLGHFSAVEDPVALEGAEDSIEAALFDHMALSMHTALGLYGVNLQGFLFCTGSRTRTSNRPEPPPVASLGRSCASRQRSR